MRLGCAVSQHIIKGVEEFSTVYCKLSMKVNKLTCVNNCASQDRNEL